MNNVLEDLSSMMSVIRASGVIGDYSFHAPVSYAKLVRDELAEMGQKNIRFVELHPGDEFAVCLGSLGRAVMLVH